MIETRVIKNCISEDCLMTGESVHDIMLSETAGSKMKYTLVLCIHVHFSTV